MQNQLISSHVLPTPSPPPEPETDFKNEKITLKRKSWIKIVQRLLKELDGRDKMMKTIQYFIKILLHYKLIRAKHWSTMASQFSMTRKILRLGTAVGPFQEIEPKLNYRTAILLNEIINGVSDDIFCFHKLGFVSTSIGTRAEIISAYCWFIGILNDIKDQVQSLKKLQRNNGDKDKIFLAEISIIKLLMDAVFCACDIYHPSYSASAQAWSGFFSGLLAGYKLWIKFSL
ncbi:unnamed protein product [Rhizopus microsporus]